MSNMNKVFQSRRPNRCACARYLCEHIRTHIYIYIYIDVYACGNIVGNYSGFLIEWPTIRGGMGSEEFRASGFQ